MRIAVYREIPEDAELQRQWNVVALETSRPQVFYTYEWALAVQAAYRASLKPLLLLGYEGSDLIGVASLASDRDGKNLSFLAGTTADYCDFLIAPLRRGEFIGAVFAELGKIHAASLALANLPADSPTATELRDNSGKHGFHVYIRPAYLCAQVELRHGRSPPGAEDFTCEQEKASPLSARNGAGGSGKLRSSTDAGKNSSRAAGIRSCPRGTLSGHWTHEQSGDAGAAGVPRRAGQAI